MPVRLIVGWRMIWQITPRLVKIYIIVGYVRKYLIRTNFGCTNINMHTDDACSIHVNICLCELVAFV
jgi:sugar phosphate permease